MSSPYFKSLRMSWRRQKQRLTDTESQMRHVLEETRTDVYNQFSEKQSKWRKLAAYTVEKKRVAKSDPRILHESRDKGKRLKDAYYEAGQVDSKGMIYHYPTSKPYAEDLQTGGTVANPRKQKSARSRSNLRSRNRKINRDLDNDFLRSIGLDPNFFSLDDDGFIGF